VKPYDQATLQGRIVEIISFPFASTETPGAPNDRVMIRAVPGEPTTMIEAAVAELVLCPKAQYVHVARVLNLDQKHDFPLEMLKRDYAWFWELKLASLEIPEEGIEIYTINNNEQIPWTVHWSAHGCGIKPIYRRDLSLPNTPLRKY